MSDEFIRFTEEHGREAALLAGSQTVWAAQRCPLCKGKGVAVAVDAIEPDGRLTNPRKATCMVCDGTGYATPDDDANP